MNVPSPLLSVLKHHGAQGGEGEAMIQVPPIALPVIQIPVALTETNPSVQIIDPQASSVLISRQTTLNNVVAATIDFLALRPGLWRIDIFASVAFSSEPALPYTQLRVGIEIPRNTTHCSLLTVMTRAGTSPVNLGITRVLSLDREAVIVIETPLVGVADTISYELSLYAARLL